MPLSGSCRVWNPSWSVLDPVAPARWEEDMALGQIDVQLDVCEKCPVFTKSIVLNMRNFCRRRVYIWFREKTVSQICGLGSEKKNNKILSSNGKSGKPEKMRGFFSEI